MIKAQHAAVKAHEADQIANVAGLNMDVRVLANYGLFHDIFFHLIGPRSLPPNSCTIRAQEPQWWSEYA